MCGSSVALLPRQGAGDLQDTQAGVFSGTGWATCKSAGWRVCQPASVFSSPERPLPQPRSLQTANQYNLRTECLMLDTKENKFTKVSVAVQGTTGKRDYLARASTLRLTAHSFHLLQIRKGRLRESTQDHKSQSY